MLPPQELRAGCVYPPLKRIRDISVEIAAAVIKCAYDEGHLHNRETEKALEAGPEVLKTHIRTHQYKPEYAPLVRVPQHLVTFDQLKHVK